MIFVFQHNPPKIQHFKRCVPRSNSHQKKNLYKDKPSSISCQIDLI
jgi:hypothetical protein